MAEPIIVYSNGQEIVIDDSLLYDPFPKPDENCTDDSQDSQGV